MEKEGVVDRPRLRLSCSIVASSRANALTEERPEA
jgi:hypothetical protein